MNNTESQQVQGEISTRFYRFLISMVAVNTLIAVLTVFLNFLIILTFLKTVSLRTPSNVLVLGLAITDFMTGIVVIPCYCIYLYATWTPNGSMYFLTKQISFSLASIVLVASFYNVVAITLDRLLAIVLHLRYNYFVTCKRYSFVLGGIWIISLIFGICRIYYQTRKEMKMVFFVVFFISMGINIMFLVKISRTVRRHSRQIQSQQQSTQSNINIPRFKKSLNTMYYIIAAFVLCYSPYSVTTALDAWNESLLANYDVLKIATQTILMANSLVNPVIYCIRIDEIRRCILKLFTTS